MTADCRPEEHYMVNLSQRLSEIKKLVDSGKYLRAFHKGDWAGLPARYRAVLDYAAEHGLKLTGYSYEKGINEIVIDRIEDYIVQIEIPVSG